MKRLSLLALLALSLAAGPAFAADPPAKQLWKNAKLSMAVKDRFHVVHEKKEKLDCEDCHDKATTDPLFLRAGEFQAKEGDVDREGCLTCHKSPKKPIFYGTMK